MPCWGPGMHVSHAVSGTPRSRQEPSGIAQFGAAGRRVGVLLLGRPCSQAIETPASAGPEATGPEQKSAVSGLDRGRDL